MNPNRVYSRDEPDELEELVRQSNEGQKAMDEGKLTPFMRKSYEKMFGPDAGIIGLSEQQKIKKLKEAQSLGAPWNPVKLENGREVPAFRGGTRR
jgi:hypothetical protein